MGYSGGMSVDVKIVWYGYCREGDRWEEQRLENVEDELSLCARWGINRQQLIICPMVEVRHVVEDEDYWQSVSSWRIPDAPPWRGGRTPRI